MTRLSKSLIACFSLVAMSVSASQANADQYRHIQQLALQTQLKTDGLMGKTHHYVHTPNYQRMIRCIADMRARAVRIHVLSLQRGCLYSMKSELARLDSQFHQIEALFDTTEVQASHGHGHIHGATRHVKELLKCIEDNIHHMRDDIELMTRTSLRRPYTSGYSSGYGGSYTSGYGSSYGSGYGSSYGSGSCSSGYGNYGYRSRSGSHRGNTYKSHPRSRNTHQRSAHRGGHAGVDITPGGVRIGNGKFNVQIGF